MIERLITWSARNPVIVIVLALAVAGAGVYSLVNTPVDAIPDQSENQVIVFADWMGRSPREVEDQVTYPLSVNLQGLAGVKAIRATSEFGFSMVNIIFEDDVDFYFARERVLERLSLASTFLPADVTAYLAPDATALGQIFWYTLEGDGYDLGRLRAVQDWFVRYQLYSVPGVAEVASVGGYPQEYQIDVDPNKLRAYGITLGELYSAVARSNSSVGGRVVQKAGAEYLVRSIGWIESLADVENIVVKSVGGTPVTVAQVAAVQFGSGPRRASLEKDGNEAVGGVVLMRYGENPLEVTERIKAKIVQLQPGLPEGVRIVPFYDRTRLIESAIDTVSDTLLQEMLVASAAILLILWHARSALIVCLTLPLAVLISFILMRVFGIPSNIMSLSGIAISIGVLVDASIVMVENAMHHLHERFGAEKVRGPTTELVLPALRTVGRPIFFSLLIMIISFLPVFALAGREGKMFHPLAFTKSFAMIGVAVMAVTLVPALVPLLVRGRLRGEEESWLVRRVIEIYRPVISFLLEHPWPIVWITGLIFVFGATILGAGLVTQIVVALGFGAILWAAITDPHWAHRVAGTAAAFTLLAAALFASQRMDPLGREFMPPLDEGTALEMPVTIPRASITQVSDDLKARDAILRSFPEVESVVGKAGRAETPTDPAPPDMIETVINFRPREHWPKRKLRSDDALEYTGWVLDALVAVEVVPAPADAASRADLVSKVSMASVPQFDELMRQMALRENSAFELRLERELTEFAVRRTVELLDDAGRLQRAVSETKRAELADRFAPEFGRIFARSMTRPDVIGFARGLARELTTRGAVAGGADALVLERSLVERLATEAGEVIGIEPDTFFTRLERDIAGRHDAQWREHIRQLNWKLFDAAVPGWTWLATRAVLEQHDDVPEAHRLLEEFVDSAPPASGDAPLAALRERLHERIADSLLLWPKEREDLAMQGGDMDALLDMPGWSNVWTQPIINRIEMLASGVRTMIGVKVFGDDLDEIQRVSNEIARVLETLPGAAGVVPDQIVGEGYLEIDIDRERAARYGINVGDIQDVVESALGGRVITTTVEGRERFPVRIRYARDFRQDEESVKNLLIAANGSMAAGSMMEDGTSLSEAVDAPAPSTLNPQPSTLQIPLSQVAEVRIVEGPSMIKSENGLLRAYVQLNVTGRDLVGFVEEARRAVAERVQLPAGMYIEWAGQFEHELRARRTLLVVVPAVLLAILILLYITYHDLADTLAVLLLAVPGAIAGGLLFQWLFGFNFSVAVWIGYIACFGLATENGLVMLVYLREAIANRGGLENLTDAGIRAAVMDGAVHRTRPKLLTELTTIVGLAPMLWASGVGAEYMQPMAAPVLGGMLVSDEVIDMLLPVLFYRIRLRRRRKLLAARSEQPA